MDKNWTVKEITTTREEDGSTVLVAHRIMDGSHIVVDDVDTEEHARLIASAPDLLEALKNAVSQLERMGSDGLSSGAIAAISKAEGRS